MWLAPSASHIVLELLVRVDAFPARVTAMNLARSSNFHLLHRIFTMHPPVPAWKPAVHKSGDRWSSVVSGCPGAGEDRRPDARDQDAVDASTYWCSMLLGGVERGFAGGASGRSRARATAGNSSTAGCDCHAAGGRHGKASHLER